MSADTTPQSRVYAAAAEIDREGGKPTVVTVRERAGVNNADATRYLRAWREEQASAGTRLAAIPAALVEQTQRAAAAMWAEATTLAAASHAALEREWQTTKALQEQEIAELSADLDTATQAAAAAAEAHAQELRAAEEALAEARAEAAAAVAAEGAARREVAELEAKLLQERTVNETLRETLDLLMTRIPAAEAGPQADAK